MNRRIAFVFLIFVLWLSAICVVLSATMVFQAKELSDRPDNYRMILDQFTRERGTIMSSDGKVLAISRKKPGTIWYDRLYPYGDTYAPVTGYLSRRFGRTGIEQARNDSLMQSTPRDELSGIFGAVTGARPAGNDVFLTLETKVQATAMANLRFKRGAVVAMDPKTGAVLAMASSPAYRPGTVDSRFAVLRRDKSSPLLNRAAQGLYVPGSSFKVVPAAAALEEGLAKPATRFVDTGRLEVDGTVISNNNKEVFGEHDLIEALTFSINSTFAKLGLDIGAGRLVRFAEGFGFNGDIPFELPVKTSTIPEAGAMSDADLAETAIGQDDLLATPLQMCLVVSSIANGGKVQQPYIVKEVRTKTGYQIEKATPSVWKEAMSAETAESLSKMMYHVVEEGTGQSAAIHGIVVAGKTGTAQLAQKNRSNAWFVGFAPADDPEVAIAVVIENVEGTGGQVAAPIARKVMESALRMQPR